MRRALLLLTAACALPALSGCENRKASCERLYDKINECNAGALKPSKRAKRDFLANCQKEYDKGTVKKTRECVKKHSDCAKMQACIRKALALKEKGPSS